MIKVEKLKNISDKDINTLAHWLYEFWGKDEGQNIEGMKCYVKSSMQDKNLPQIYGLYKDEELIGMYSFTYDDLTVRPDIYPWLSNVYIKEEERGKGYGRILLNSVKENLKKNTDLKEIFLYTKHLGLYEKFGWTFVSEIDTFEKNDKIQRLYSLKVD